MTSNTDMLNDILEMGIVEMAGLPADQLTLLNGEAAEALDQAKQIGDRLDGAPDLKYGAILAAAGKDVATVRFDDGDYVIATDLPEREEWDQTLLAETVEVIRHSWRHNPTQYVPTRIKGSEAAYRSWPALLRCLLDPARASEASKSSDRIEPAGKGDA
jgi:hypothetical protein